MAYGEPVLFSSRRRAEFVTDVPMIGRGTRDVCRADVLKPQPFIDGDRERMLVDGGVYVNNPSILGYLLGGRAAAAEGRPLLLVSLGAGTRPPRAPLTPVQMNDSFSTAQALMSAVASGGGAMGDALLSGVADGDAFRYWRVQTTVGTCSFTMDDSTPENVACLGARARELVEGAGCRARGDRVRGRRASRVTRQSSSRPRGEAAIVGRVPQRIPGKLDLPQVYNDTFRGWPVKPQSRQHPIRGSFLDPRPDPDKGAIYHDGVDVSVRDDRPERGRAAEAHAPGLRDRGRPCVTSRRRKGQRGFVHAGHFGYGHIDPVVSTGETVFPGQHIGWTCEGDWHVHLSEFVFTTGPNISVNPLRPGGKVHPYVDTAPPDIHEIRFYTVVYPDWERRPTTSVALLPQAGQAHPRGSLFGRVDVRVRVSDPQSFIGWFKDHPELAAPHHPFRLAVAIVDVARGRIVRRREAFQAEQVLDQAAGAISRREPTRTCPRRAASSGTSRSAATASTGFGCSRTVGHGATRRREVRGARAGMGRRRQRVPLDRPGDDRERCVAIRRRARARASARRRAAAGRGSSRPCGSSGP